MDHHVVIIQRWGKLHMPAKEFADVYGIEMMMDVSWTHQQYTPGLESSELAGFIRSWQDEGAQEGFSILATLL